MCPQSRQRLRARTDLCSLPLCRCRLGPLAADTAAATVSFTYNTSESPDLLCIHRHGNDTNLPRCSVRGSASTMHMQTSSNSSELERALCLPASLR